MAEQIAAGTPDSNTGASSKEKPNTAKDRACPFCNQQFTSSSLGRHLDLYIKEKNPKPPDGVHNVDEIRKIRGHITRRQPRNSTSKRESSTPAGTPATSGRSPSLATAFIRKPSPGSARTPDGLHYPSGVNNRLNHANWEATGVINDVPPIPRNGYSQGSWDVEDDMRRRHAEGKKSMSKQLLAKSTYEQKQKELDALDNARAAELALREVMGSIRAANERTKPNLNSPFDYDPLALDFPALCLHCLPPPPTLYQTTPIHSPHSWSIEPPDHTQYDSLRHHFQTQFHSWRLAALIVERRNSQESSEPGDYNDASAQQQASHAQETSVSNHLNTAFSHWNSLSPAARLSHWRIELARSVGRKADQVTQLKETQSFLAQENAHLKAQVDQLSRLQAPREFRIFPPQTYPVSPEVIGQLNDIGLHGRAFGFELSEKKEDITTIVNKAIARWKTVVQSSRGMPGQKRLDPDSMNVASGQAQSAHGHPSVLSREDEDGEGERDADMEVDDHYIEMANGTPARAPEASMPMGIAESSSARYGNNGIHSANNGRNGNLMGISDFEQVSDNR